jgi:hypothetical protein
MPSGYTHFTRWFIRIFPQYKSERPIHRSCDEAPSEPRSLLMRRLPSYAFLTTVICALALVPSAAQEGKERKPDFAEPKKDWKWDEDKRFDFLMERLASLEASLDAVDRAIAKASGKKGSKLGEARRAEAGNSAMDRKGGGPMKWNEFYGTTAEKFFYHPVDPSTSYHTGTVLRQMGSDQDDKLLSGIPSSQSIPAHQRPPQFDYIYRANQDAKTRAESEAAAIQGQLDSLLERREKLETEQADLWCRLAFRAIQRLNIPRRPELRFRLVAASTEPADEKRAVVLEAAARFLASALLIIEKADEDQATALGNIKRIVTNARNEFDDVLLANSEVSADSSDREKPLGQFTALAQLLDDTSNNLSESYEVAIDGSRAKDAARKDQFRGLLQRSLIEYAQVVMALDEVLRAIMKEWSIAVDRRTMAAISSLEWDAPVRSGSRDRGELADGVQRDPLIGKWRWFVGGVEKAPVEFFPGGECAGEGIKATWTPSTTTVRRYEVYWPAGMTDVVTMTADGLSLTGRNTLGWVIEGQRHDENAVLQRTDGQSVGGKTSRDLKKRRAQVPLRIPPGTVLRNKKRYLFSSDKAPYSVALQRAQQLGGTLLVIEDDEENTWVASRLSGPTWLGLTRKGGVAWYDEDETRQRYLPWADGQPSNAAEEVFVCILPDGNWHDYLDAHCHYCIVWK